MAVAKTTEPMMAMRPIQIKIWPRRFFFFLLLYILDFGMCCGIRNLAFSCKLYAFYYSIGIYELLKEYFFTKTKYYGDGV